LPQPFFVIATQNPAHQIGTFPLPESQLDRFLMRIDLGYPDASAERELLKGTDRRELIATLPACLSAQELIALQREVVNVHIAEALLDYLQAIIRHTRETPRYAQGLSPRAGLALLRGAQAWAFMAGRAHVVPEDVQAVLPSVVSHRLHASAESLGGASDQAAQELLGAVAIP
jgi:MoxR-like ATPase